VTNEGGPRFLVVHGETGYIAEQDSDFVAKVVELAHNRELIKQLGAAARQRMAGISWDAAFDKTYAAYRHCLPEQSVAAAPVQAKMAQAHANSQR